MISSNLSGGFKTLGYSVNMDVVPYDGMMIRVEGKLYQSLTGSVFERKLSGKSTLSPSVAISFCYSFQKVFDIR